MRYSDVTVCVRVFKLDVDLSKPAETRCCIPLNKTREKPTVKMLRDHPGLKESCLYAQRLQSRKISQPVLGHIRVKAVTADMVKGL